MMVSNWEELKELMQGLPRSSDQYNQVVGDAVVAVDRDIAQLEADKNCLWAQNYALRELEKALTIENQRLREFANTIMYASDGRRRNSLGLTFTKAIEDLQDALKESE